MTDRLVRKCNLGGFYGLFFFLEYLKFIFCFAVTMRDLVHDLETILDLSSLLTVSGNLF